MYDHPAVYPNKTVVPSASLSNPSIFSPGGDFLSFPFLQAQRWCHAHRVSIAPNNPVNLSAASCYHTFLLKKRGEGKAANLRSSGWKQCSQITVASDPLQSYLPSHGRDGGKEKLGFAIFLLRWVDDKATFYQSWAFVFDMNFIILFWPLPLAAEQDQKRPLLRLENSNSTAMKGWKIQWGLKNNSDHIYLYFRFKRILSILICFSIFNLASVSHETLCALYSKETSQSHYKQRITGVLGLLECYLGIFIIIFLYIL